MPAAEPVLLRPGLEQCCVSLLLALNLAPLSCGMKALVVDNAIYLGSVWRVVSAPDRAQSQAQLLMKPHQGSQQVQGSLEQPLDLFECSL